MSKIEEYQRELLECPDQERFLLANSCLPGPRSNLELLYAFLEVSELNLVEQLLDKTFPVLPANNPEEFVQCCAVTSLGKHILNGNDYLIIKLRAYASDNRWRIRESVAMAIQHIGKISLLKLKETIAGWENGNNYEQRAVAAGLCEPAILKSNEMKNLTLQTLQTITNQLENNRDPRDESFKTLVQALCYCWSVALVADPINGKPLFERMVNSDNKFINKILKENLKKNRLIKMDAVWVENISMSLPSK